MTSRDLSEVRLGTTQDPAMAIDGDESFASHQLSPFPLGIAYVTNEIDIGGPSEQGPSTGYNGGSAGREMGPTGPRTATKSRSDHSRYRNGLHLVSIPLASNHTGGCQEDAQTNDTPPLDSPRRRFMEGPGVGFRGKDRSRRDNDTHVATGNVWNSASQNYFKDRKGGGDGAKYDTMKCQSRPWST